jgi:hypothetical protein
MIKILDDFDVKELLEFYKKVEDDILWTEYNNGKQTGLQYRTGSNQWTDAVGPWKQGETKWKDGLINSFFIGTPFEEVISKYNLYRTRLMWAKPFACYSMHQDYSPRVHIPLITNPDCYFVFKETGLTHLPVGKVYWTDTTKFHTAMNCSKEWRLHLVGEVSQV